MSNTRELIENLKAKIVKTMALPMLKRVGGAQECVVESVKVIEALNIEIETQRIEIDILKKHLIEHIKMGHM